MNGKIYVIKNTINSKVYIGQTIQEVKDRFKQHLKCCKSNKTQLIQKAILKYGKDNFYFEILKQGISNYQNLNYWEEYYIEKYNSLKEGYNLCPGGQYWRNQPKLDTEKYTSQIIKMYVEDKLSSRKIASHFNVCHTTIQKILNKNNISLRKKNYKLPNRQTKATFELIKPLLTKGLSIWAIGRKLKVADSTVKRIISEHS